MMAKRTTTAKSTPAGQVRPDLSKQHYNFALNPYPDSRCSTCPICHKPTGQRKVPLLIHIEPLHSILLNYTCRYCASCNLLIAHQHELEANLTDLFQQHDPTIIGNEYLVMGVMPRQVWQEGMTKPQQPQDAIEQLTPFLSYSTLQRSQTGWFPEGVVPPLEPAPPARDWVKTGYGPKARVP